MSVGNVYGNSPVDIPSIGGQSGGTGGAWTFADGGIMTQWGPLQLKKYSLGGIAYSPQLAMFGEGSDPEAYVPLKGGRIPVSMTGGSTTHSVSVPITIHDANASKKMTHALRTEVEKVVHRVIKDHT